MSFIKANLDVTPIVDTVFTVVRQAAEAKAKYGNDAVVDATIGSLYDESGNLVALKTVFDNYDALDSRVKAKYSSAFLGNATYRESVTKWVLGNSDCDLNSAVCATPGGTGAVNLTIDLCLSEGQTLVIPNIAWGSYAIMANKAGLKVQRYQMFDGDSFNLTSFKSVCKSVMDEQGKLVVVINDPCHNPTGYSMSNEEWQEVVDFINELSQRGSVVLLNDIAYLDYAYDLEKARSYMNLFNKFTEEVLVVVAFSCSKLMTSYGLRCGAALLLTKSVEALKVVEASFEKAARSLWSNVNNSAMENFYEVVTNRYDEFMKEKDEYIALLKERSDIVVREANECGLPIYPYKEGFFVTVKCENALRDKYHDALLSEHIYTVKVNEGIRVAVCSLPVEKCKGLAKRMNAILEGCK